MKPTRLMIACLWMVVSLAIYAGDSAVTVGRQGSVTFAWAGEPLRTVDQTLESPFYCEISEVRSNDTETVYVLNYTLLEPGEHNLNTALLNLQGRPVEGLPDIIVSAPTLLPENYQGELVPYTIEPVDDLTGFSLKMVAVAALWAIAGMIGLYMIWPRKEEVVTVQHDRGPTVADLLQPLIEKAVADELSVEEKVRLNQILFRFWQTKLGLKDSDPQECLSRLRDHGQAGELLTCLDQWLFSPEPVSGDQLSGILQPYAGTMAADLHLEDMA